jgi:hypothetical protein
MFFLQSLSLLLLPTLLPSLDPLRLVGVDITQCIQHQSTCPASSCSVVCPATTVDAAMRRYVVRGGDHRHLSGFIK